MEAQAIKQVFGTHTSRAAIYSIKSMVGESLGAAGALQVASGLMTLVERIIPPTVHFQSGEASWGLESVSHYARQRDATTAMINSFGCDGNNASLVLQRCELPAPE